MFLNFTKSPGYAPLIMNGRIDPDGDNGKFSSVPGPKGTVRVFPAGLDPDDMSPS